MVLHVPIPAHRALRDERSRVERANVRVDLNADVGESPASDGADGLDSVDRELLPHISSANVACGGHAGDRASMTALARHAKALGVAIGAHVSYVDREGFGRRRLDIDHRLLRDQIVEQISVLEECAASVGASVAYVKPHGALYNVTADPADKRCLVHAGAVVDACYEASRTMRRDLAIVGLPGSDLLRSASRVGLLPIAEAFADRGYGDDGRLIDRQKSGALLNPGEAAARVVDLVERGGLHAASGKWLDLPSVQTICLHSDTPGAVDMAREIRSALSHVDVRPFSVTAG